MTEISGKQKSSLLEYYLSWLRSVGIEAKAQHLVEIQLYDKTVMLKYLHRIIKVYLNSRSFFSNQDVENVSLGYISSSEGQKKSKVFFQAVVITGYNKTKFII